MNNRRHQTESGSRPRIARASAPRRVSRLRGFDLCDHRCSASLTPPAKRAPRLRPSRPGWMGHTWIWRASGQKSLTVCPSRLSSVSYDQRTEYEDLRIRSSLRSPLRLDGRRAARGRLEDKPTRGEPDKTTQATACVLVLARSCESLSARRSTPSIGGRQEVEMYKTTKRRMAQSGRRVRPTAPWSFGLHRRIAAAATAGVICVFSLQMRRCHENPECVDPVDRTDSLSARATSDGKFRDAERREESP